MEQATGPELFGSSVVERREPSIMKSIGQAGRVIFALSMAAFGVQYVIYGAFKSGIGPPWAVGASLWSYAGGLLLIAAGAGLVNERAGRTCALVLGIGLFVSDLIYFLPRSVADPSSGDVRTGVFEILTMSGAALSIAGALSRGNETARLWIIVGRAFFGVSMIVFGIDHFLYASFVASLAPDWIPGHLFWTYFTAVGFVAGGIGIGVNFRSRLSGTALGLMFFLWVAVLHAPRVALASNNANEWTSMFVALAMCGASCVFVAREPVKASITTEY